MGMRRGAEGREKKNGGENMCVSGGNGTELGN